MKGGRAKYAHGLITGKFYPPHAGHHHLIDTAAGTCARLSVVVAAARTGSPLLVRDTDAFATAVWHERYLGAPAPEAEAVHRRIPHLWILTAPEGVPFEQDGWRDGESIRSWMSGRFHEELEPRALPHITVTGPTSSA